MLICLSEGQGIEPATYEAAFACATAPENRLLNYGNPTRPSGPFYQAATSDTWHVITIRADEHPNVASGRAEIPGAVSREWISQMRDEYGESSPIYQARVLARFPENAVDGLIQRAWLRAAFDRHEDGSLEPLAAAHRMELALDIARRGPDASVLAVIQGPIVREFVYWHGLGVDESVDRLMAHGRQVALAHARSQGMEGLEAAGWLYKPLAHVDEPGLGGGAIDYLVRQNWPTSGFIGSASASDPRRYANQRAESHWTFARALEEGTIALPRNDALEEEALAIEWTENKQGQIQILAKSNVRSAIGRSPDTLDAAVIGISRTVGSLSRKVSYFKPIY